MIHTKSINTSIWLCQQLSNLEQLILFPQKLLTQCKHPEATTGDCVTLLGRDGDAEIQVDTWAKLKGTHAYDIICSIGSRVERRCV